MTVPKEINSLIERFQENRDVYCSSQYNEAQARIEFIDPLFKALGWDMTNEKGYAEAYKEVIHEDAIKVGGATKAPDYAFRIGGVRKFFVEAKRPGLNIKEDGDAAYQLRRYAWSAKLPLSIVTDFEEFAVYDSRIKPAKTDKASAGRVLYLTVDQYYEHWDEIAQIFSQDAILTGSFDKYVQSAKKKRGTAEVDTAFLKEIEGWRNVLARNIALRNGELSTRELNFAVQRTIDRIIFLRICEDRGVEDYGQLMALQNGTNIYQRLCQIFRRADERYNSGLFHFGREKDRLDPPDNLTLGLAIDDNLIKGIIKGLYYPESPFEFSVLPADILGHIYEQFLGKVIRLTPGHHAKVEDKPEVKKAGGVYYTPTYIVDYIVKNTVGKLLEQNTPTKVSSLRILDPACGSGSFLLGAYQTLLDWHQEWYAKHDPEKHAKGKNPRLYRTIDPSPSGRGQGEGAWRLTTAERKRILLNNIYGVDIDTQAVEVTKLSLLLKVLEGENAETLGKNLRLFHERALPDLGNNIKCGNSLIGPDFYEGKQISLLDEEERYRINAFDWKAEFPEIMTAGGFHAVIGNPPYIQLSMKEYFSVPVAEYMKNHFSSSMGRLNTFGLFWERSLATLARDSGFVSYIVPNTILTQGYYERLRRLFLERKVNHIAVYEYCVFKGAVVEPVILTIQNSSNGKNNIRIETYQNPSEAPTTGSMPQEVFETTYQRSFQVKVRPEALELKAKTDGQWPKFESLLNINQAIALKGDRSLSLYSLREGDNFYPVLDGREINRYVTRWSGNFLEYELSRIHSCKRTDIFECEEKILFRRVGESIVATLDCERYYALNTLVVVTPSALRQHQLTYVLGVFNSRLINFYYRQFLKSPKRTFSEIQAQQVGQLPLRTIDFSDQTDKDRHNCMLELVEGMLKLCKDLQAAKTDHEKSFIQRQINATDKQIDHLVYELYGLTKEEITIVEEVE